MNPSKLENSINNVLSDITTLQEKLLRDKQLEQDANELFAKNLAVLEKYAPSLHKVFVDYHPHSIKSTFTPSGHLTITEPASGLALYSDNPPQQTKKYVDKFLDSAICTSLSFSQQEDGRGYLHYKAQNKLVQIRESWRGRYDILKKAPEYMPSLVIAGIGLGYHLMQLLEHVSPNYLYIYEPEPDVFYASLHAIDWQEIYDKLEATNSTMYLDVGSEPSEFCKSYSARVMRDGRYNASRTYYFQHYPSVKINTAVKELKYEYKTLTSAWGFFDDGITAIANTMRSLELKIPVMLRQRKLAFNYSTFPIFVVANGPSLDDTLDVIREYQGNALILSCGSAIDSLHRAGIKPDIHVEVERVYTTAYRLQKLKDNDPDYIKGIFLMGNNILHPEVYDIFDHSFCGLKGGEAFTSMFQHQLDTESEYAFLSMSNPMAANMGMSVAGLLGFNEIYLCGVDCGYISEAHHHASNSTYYAKGKDLKTFQDPGRGHADVKGNFQEKVKTTYLLDLSRRQLEGLISIIKSKRKTAHIYNLSNGAFIEGTLPLQHDLVLIDDGDISKNEVKESLKQSFKVPNISREDFEKCMNKTAFRDLCEQLVSYFAEDFTSRAEFVAAIKEQAIVLFSTRVPKLDHLFYLVEGSLYTINSLLFEMAYMFDDEQQSMTFLNEGLVVAREFYASLPDKYDNTYDCLDMFVCDRIKTMYGE